MASILENMQISSCFWFDNDDKRNALASMLAGTFFFVGWWLIIDVHAKYPQEMLNSYHLCGVFGTVSLLMVNSVNNARISGDYSGGFLGPTGARGWLFIGLVMGFSAVIAACWILFANFVTADAQHHWPGVGLFLQNVFILLGSLTFKFGRTDDNWG